MTTSVTTTGITFPDATIQTTAAASVNATNSNSSIMILNTIITGNVTVAAYTGGLSVGPVTIANNQTVTVANNARWVVL